LNPGFIGNVSLNYFSDFGVKVYLSAQYIGKQYLDNSENERKDPQARNLPGYVDKFINPYSVVNAGVSVDLISMMNSKSLNKYFKSLEASLKINNIFDRLYETTGSVDSYGTAYWIPAATRNVFFELKLGF